MPHQVLLSPVCDLLSNAEGIETQVLFGERICNHNHRHYAYSQLVFSSIWKPYPGDSLQNIPLFSSQLQPPNAVVCSQEAFLDPWHIPLPFAAPLHIDNQNQVSLSPASIALLNSNSRSNYAKAFCSTKEIRFLNSSFSLRDLVSFAEQLIDTPYVWGGRCIHKQLPRNGVDCSGYIQLLYQVTGRNIPRNARDQYRDCSPVKDFSSLPIGGLIFLKKTSTGQINHVMMKISEHEFIHAAEKIGKVEKVILGNRAFFKGNLFCSLGEPPIEAVFGVPKNRKAFF